MTEVAILILNALVLITGYRRGQRAEAELTRVKATTYAAEISLDRLITQVAHVPTAGEIAQLRTELRTALERLPKTRSRKTDAVSGK